MKSNLSGPYQSSGPSKILGFISFALTISAIIALLFLAWKIAIAAFLGAIVSGFIGFRLAGGGNNPAIADHRLKKWARSIALTEIQRSALRELWVAGKNDSPPIHDPLTALSIEELAFVKKVCRADFRPHEFDHKLSSELRYARFLSLKKRGFSDDHAAIITGMTFNMVGNPELGEVN